MDSSASDGSRQHSPTNTDANNKQRTVWPIDDLTRGTEDAIVGGELVATNPDAGTVELEAVGQSDEHVTIDLSQSGIREYLFVNEPDLIHLIGVEAVVFGMFLRMCGTEDTTASVFDPVSSDGERMIVPNTSTDNRAFEVVIA